MKFAKRTAWPAASNLLSVEVNSLKKNNIPFLDLSVSNPALCGFNYLNPEILKPLRDLKNLFYEPDPHGLLKAREAVAVYYSKKGIHVHPDQIILTANTSEAYSFIFRLLFEPGESLLAPQPSYPLLDYLAALHDIKLKRYPLTYNGQWQIDLDECAKLATSSVRALLLVNPNNPTGNFLKERERNFISSLCRDHSLLIIADEVFLDFHFGTDSTPVSFASHADTLTFTLSGISKILGLPQMKLSWIVVSGPEKIRREAIRRLEIISDTYLSVSTPVQNALPVWLSKQKEITKEILERIKANYEFLVQRIGSNNSPSPSPLPLQGGEDKGEGVAVFRTEGGWNAVLKFPAARSDEEWALLLLREDRVLTHPGYLFDFTEDHFLMISLLTPFDIFKEGVERILSRIWESRTTVF